MSKWVPWISIASCVIGAAAGHYITASFFWEPQVDKFDYIAGAITGIAVMWFVNKEFTA